MDRSPQHVHRKGAFVRLLTAYFISAVGDWLYKLALPLLVFQITGSAVQMAGTFALTFLPFLLISVFGGVIADRFQRKRVLIACDLSACLFLGLIAWSGGYLGSMPALYVFVFLAASVTPIHHPSFQAFIPEVVAEKDLAKANALVSGSENIISIGAPILTGLVVAAIGPTNTILLNALSFAVSGLLVWSVKVENPYQGEAPGRPVLDTIKEGFASAWRYPVLKYGALLFVCSNFAINLFQANLVFYLADILDASAQMIGLVFGLTGLGAVLGAAVAPWLIKRFEAGMIIVTSTILAGLFTFPLLFVDHPVLIGLIWSSETAFGAVNMMTYFTYRQRSVPKHLLGRTVAITRLISFSGIPLGALLGGVLLEHTSIAVVIFLSGAIRLAGGIAAVFTPLAQKGSSHPRIDRG